MSKITGLLKRIRLWFRPSCPNRWRAEHGEVIYCLWVDLSPARTLCDPCGRFEVGNYFRTKEQAKEASVAIRKLLDRLHDKWGE